MHGTYSKHPVPGVSANKRYSGEDVIDGLMQQPRLHSTIKNFPCNYSFGHDLSNAPVGKSNKPRHVLIFAEKGEEVPQYISSIPYYIHEPPDGKWEMNVTILKSMMDLSNMDVDEEVGHKVVSTEDWTELPARNIELPFNTALEDFGIQCYDDDGEPTHLEACVRLLLELRGIQFVVHALGRLDGKDDGKLRNLHSFKRHGYQVHGFDDSTTYFHLITSTPTRILEGSKSKPIGMWKRHLPLGRMYILT